MIRVPVTFDSANRRKDRSVRMAFTTNLEVDTDDFMQMDHLVLSAGWLIFADNEVTESDVPAEPAPEEFSKPWGQRLRAVLFLIWQTKTSQEMPFDTWAKAYKEDLLDRLKEKLD